jgi:predicted nucleotidyltransferase component of viral defense system
VDARAGGERLSGPINRARLEERADELGADPVYLEKDFVLTEIIHSYATGDLADQLVLKGGQALRHVHGSPRLSTDVDYVARRRLDFDELRAALNIRYPRLTVPGEPVGRTQRGFKVTPITYRGPLGNSDRVELKVSFRDDLVLPPDTVAYQSPFYDPFPVMVMRIEEMVAEKLRALYQRGNPRDLYDLWFIFTSPAIAVEAAGVVDLLSRKFDPEFVASGWNRERLYARIEQQATQWDRLLSGVAPDRPPYEEALLEVQRALRFLPNRVR